MSFTGAFLLDIVESLNVEFMALALDDREENPGRVDPSWFCESPWSLTTNGDYACVKLFHWPMWDVEDGALGELKRDVLMQHLREKAAELAVYFSVYARALPRGAVEP